MNRDRHDRVWLDYVVQNELVPAIAEGVVGCRIS